MDSQKELAETIKSLEKKIDSMQSREERDRQYRLMGISVVLASILSTLIYISFRLIESVLPQSLLIPVLLLVGYFSIILIFYYMNNMKETYRVGNFSINCNISASEKYDKIELLDRLCEISKLEGKCRIDRVHMSGLMGFDYFLKTFKEEYPKKLDYLKKNIDDVKNLDFNFGDYTNESFISLSFIEKDIEIQLSPKHFEIEKAKKIISKIEEMETKKLIFNIISEGF